MTTTPTSGTTAPQPDGSPSFSTQPKKKGTLFITPILAIVVALAVGIFGGILIGHNTGSSNASSQQRPGGNFGGGAGGYGGGAGTGSGTGTGGAAGDFTTGTVKSNSDGTLTITSSDGTTVKVTTGSDTTVTTEGKVSDLAAGDTVTVIGTKDADGNVTATRISEGTTGFGGGLGGRPGSGSTAAPSNN